jgi:hypothetical protein
LTSAAKEGISCTLVGITIEKAAVSGPEMAEYFTESNTIYQEI